MVYKKSGFFFGALDEAHRDGIGDMSTARTCASGNCLAACMALLKAFDKNSHKVHHSTHHAPLPELDNFSVSSFVFK